MSAVPVPPTDLDRAFAAFRKLVVAVIPAARFWIVHEYAVSACDGVTFTGAPTDAEFSPALPVGVPYSPALAGSFSVVPAGTLAYVGFANADPSKPYLVRFGNLAASTSTTIDAGTVAVGPSASSVPIAAHVARPVREGDTYAAMGVVPGNVVLTFVSSPDPSGSSKVAV